MKQQPSLSECNFINKHIMVLKDEATKYYKNEIKMNKIKYKIHDILEFDKNIYKIWT